MTAPQPQSAGGAGVSSHSARALASALFAKPTCSQAPPIGILMQRDIKPPIICGQRLQRRAYAHRIHGTHLAPPATFDRPVCVRTLTIPKATLWSSWSRCQRGGGRAVGCKCSAGLAGQAGQSLGCRALRWAQVEWTQTVHPSLEYVNACGKVKSKC